MNNSPFKRTNDRELGAAFNAAAEKLAEITPLKCKNCGSMIVICQPLVEAQIKRGSKLLGIPGASPDAKEIMMHRDIAYLYICSNCGEAVHLHKIAIPTEIPDASKAKDESGIGTSEQHAKGGEEEQGPA